jgi:transposase-like protein
MPFKSGARAAPIEYLEKVEIEVLLASIDRSTLSGQRDYAMFSLMFKTGARVQEILNRHIRDVRLVATFPDPPCRQRQQNARLNGEVKRRTDIVGIFPNVDAIIRLVGAILLERNDEWAVQRAHYMMLETIAS